MRFKLDFPLFDESLSSQHAVVIAQLVSQHKPKDVRELLLTHAARMGDPTGLRLLGALYEKQGKTRKAVMAYKRAHELGDRTATAHLGKLYYEWAWGKHYSERMSAAEDYLLQVLDQAGAPAFLANLYWCDGRDEEAEAMVLEYADRDTQSAVSAIEHKLVSREQAISLLEAHRDRGHLEVLGLLGKLYIKAGRLSEAKTALEEAVALGDARSGRVLGKVLWAHGDSEEARRFWKKAAKDGDRKAKKLLKKSTR